MRTLITLIGLILYTSTYCQELKLTKYALKVGPSYANVLAENTDDKGSNGYQGTDFYIGISATTALTWNFSLKQELLFSKILENSILELPLFFQYDFYYSWSAFAGFHINYIFENTSRKNVGLQDTKNFGVGIGAGLQYKLNKRFFLEGRTAYGLTEQIADFDFVNGKPFTIRMGIGYVF